MPTSRIARRLATLALIAALAAVPLTSTAALAASVPRADDPSGIDITVGVVAPWTVADLIVTCDFPYGDRAAGAEIHVSVEGVLAYSAVQIYVLSTPQLLSNGNASVDGTYETDVTLPKGLEAGTHHLIVTGTSPEGNAFEKVVAAFVVTAGGRLAKSLSSTSQTTSGGGGSVTQTPVADSDSDDALGDDPVSLGGALYVSGLGSDIASTIAPSGGDIDLELTVKNASSVRASATLRFWVTNAIGVQIAEAKGIHVDELAAGETRTISATLPDVGQWSVYLAHVTLTPPKVVGGTTMSPVTRDATLFVPPYFLIVTAGGVIAIYFAVRGILLARRRSETVAA